MTSTQQYLQQVYQTTKIIMVSKLNIACMEEGEFTFLISLSQIKESKDREINRDFEFD